MKLEANITSKDFWNLPVVKNWSDHLDNCKTCRHIVGVTKFTGAIIPDEKCCEVGSSLRKTFMEHSRSARHFIVCRDETIYKIVHDYLVRDEIVFNDYPEDLAVEMITKKTKRDFEQWYVDAWRREAITLISTYSDGHILQHKTERVPFLGQE